MLKLRPCKLGVNLVKVIILLIDTVKASPVITGGNSVKKFINIIARISVLKLTPLEYGENSVKSN